ncbi:uncharacterized protein MKK02DRAFT_42955 [Dioszegia hungarica]|uniref:Uncharacterized protein n=1 Tax=Dioszegia hungarica TaxID=4972 RepID=A0AA38HDQ1_9TREE|nr:uncharacterized protein MKK02DRAFT_42955 [Dioszegia hungarica]KAI9638556.1 hypothetical protein MKK02DRAFT_42955 [Dioszegia hungarica]
MQDATTTATSASPSARSSPSWPATHQKTSEADSILLINPPPEGPHDDNTGIYASQDIRDAQDTGREEPMPMPPIPDTQGGMGDDDDLMSDMRAGGGDGGRDGADVDMAYEDEQAYYDQEHGDIDPRHYYTEDGRYQTDLRGFTPESEHGAGAITLYQQHEANNGPQRPFRDQGRTDARGEYDINAYAARGGRGMQVDSSVRVPDGVEEPASPMMPGHGPINTAQSIQYPSQPNPNANLNGSGPGNNIASARAKGQFVPPHHGQKMNGHSGASANVNGHAQSGPSGPHASKKEHVEVQEIGGRRILTKRAGSKRDTCMSEEDEELEFDEPERVQEFDPTAPIVKFDTKKMLVEEWEKIQAEIVPFLKNYVEEKLKSTYDEIQYVTNLFVQLNEDARKDLEDGVKRIEEEETKQEDCRKIIINFSRQMEEVAAVMSQFGGAVAAAAAGRKEVGGSAPNEPLPAQSG